MLSAGIDSHIMYQQKSRMLQWNYSWKTFSFTSRNEKLLSLNLLFLRVIATQPCTNKLKEIKGPF